MDERYRPYSSDIFFKDAVNTSMSGISLDTATNPTFEGLYFVEGKGRVFRKVARHVDPVETRTIEIQCGGAEIMYKKIPGSGGVNLSHIKFGSEISHEAANQLQDFVDAVPLADHNTIATTAAERLAMLRPTAVYVPDQGLIFVADGQPRIHVDMNGRVGSIEDPESETTIGALSLSNTLEFDIETGDVTYEIPNADYIQTGGNSGGVNRLMMTAGIIFNHHLFPELDDIAYRLEEYSENWYYLAREIINPYLKIQQL